jgi:hypothetical protein
MQLHLTEIGMNPQFLKYLVFKINTTFHFISIKWTVDIRVPVTRQVICNPLISDSLKCLYDAINYVERTIKDLDAFS